MKTFYLLLLALSISAISCKTKDGEPGPAGESGLNKQGSISGTITYTNDDGNTATAPFSYQYYESIEHNYFTYDEEGSESYYEVDFARRDLKDPNNYFNFEIEGYGMNGIEDNPDYNYINFSLFTVVNNELQEFYGYSNFDITNFSLDHTTGRVTFNFSGDVYHYGNLATVTGSVDVTLNRLRNYTNPS